MNNRQPLTRRQFFKKATGTAAAAFAFPYLVPSSVFGASAPSNRITMGCIGVGPNNRTGPPADWKPMPIPEGFDYDMWLGPAPWHPDKERFIDDQHANRMLSKPMRSPWRLQRQ